MNAFATWNETVVFQNISTRLPGSRQVSFRRKEENLILESYAFVLLWMAMLQNEVQTAVSWLTDAGQL